MKTVKKRLPILLADDVSLELEHEKRSKSTKQHAVFLAHHLGTSIDLIHVEDITFYPVNTPNYRPLIETYLKDQKRRLKSLASSDQVSIRPLFVDGYVVPKLLELTSKNRSRYEMIALGTHGRKGLSRMVLGSVAEDIIRNSDIPVFVIGPEAQARQPKDLPHQKLQIFVATDLGENSKLAEDYSIRFAKKLGNAEVILFHSVYEGLHPVLQTAFTSPHAKEQLADCFLDLRRQAIKKLENKIKQFRKEGVSCRFKLDESISEASAAILSELESSTPNFVVMGTHGRNFLVNAFFGSTARKVILKSPVPVITVHSKPKKRASRRSR